MSNALTNTANTAMAGDDFANPFAAAGAGAGATTYMKFTGATGDFTYGQDDEEMPHGTEMAGDIMNSKWVWTFWWEGEVLETRETTVAQDPMGYENEPDDLPEDYDGDMTLEEIRAEQADRSSNFMDGWSCQAVLGLREIGGEAEEFTLRLNKGVALNAFRALLASFGRQFKFKQGLVPIVELGARSYKSKVKGVGKRYTPVLKISDWRSEEELMSAAGEDPDMYDEPGADEGVDALPAPETEEGEAAPAEDKPARRGARGRRGNFGG
ncbi:hypothetical protein RPALISO_98 [Ruegeria phage RpAliso]|nr:hypothetical protein RPALISO_98 [Ruegeria phage RpAliso]